MARYMIMAARCEEAEYGVGCGPQISPVIAEVTLEDEQGKKFYMSASFLADAPAFFKTDISTFALQVMANPTDAEKDLLKKLLDEGYVEFGEFHDIFSKKDPNWYDVQRYLLYMLDAVYDNADEVESFIEDTTGEYTDEIDIPESRFEEDYNEMLEEDDDEDQ